MWIKVCYTTEFNFLEGGLRVWAVRNGRNIRARCLSVGVEEIKENSRRQVWIKPVAACMGFFGWGGRGVESVGPKQAA